MGVMPYHLEKGPYFSVAEAVVNATPRGRWEILDWLRKKEPMLDLTKLAKTLTSTTLSSKAYPTPNDIKRHGEDDVFGGSYDAAGKFIHSSDPFQNYSGDVEQIMRTTFIRALEVSLGLATGTDPADPDNPPRFWPVEYLWKCPTAWVEGWVTWCTKPNGDGHVTVHLLTPAHGHPVLSSPMAGRNATKDPTDPKINYGMWVITHDHHDKTTAITTDDSEFAVWSLPTLGPVFTGQGPVIVVSPSEEDGGVAPNGRPFVAPI